MSRSEPFKTLAEVSVSAQAQLHAKPHNDGSVVGLKQAQPDAELVARAIRGDRWAAEVLVRRHIKPVAAMVTRMLGDRDAADELVQDTFMVALGRLQQVKDPSAVRSWLLTIAARRVRRRMRKERVLTALGLRPHEEEFDFAQVVTDAASPEQRAELAEIAQVLARCPASHRLAWMLRHVEGYSLVETAALCECSLATVKRWIRSVEVRVAERTDSDA